MATVGHHPGPETAPPVGPARRAWRHWTGRPPGLDPRQVGLTFVDVLFALVMGQVITPFAAADKPPAAGVAQLVLAGVLTITSWIGYHSSWNRPRWFIRFPNLPLWQFMVDVLLVIDYWLLAASAQGTPGAWSSRATPIPACLLVTAAFGLYVLWDWFSKRIRYDRRYEAAPRDRDVPRRRVVTAVCFGISLLLLLVFAAVRTHSGATTVVVVIGLTFLTVVYRVMKDWYYLPETPAELRKRELSPQLDEWDQLRKVAELRHALVQRLPHLPEDQRSAAEELVGRLQAWPVKDPLLDALVRAEPEGAPSPIVTP